MMTDRLTTPASAPTRHTAQTASPPGRPPTPPPNSVPDPERPPGTPPVDPPPPEPDIIPDPEAAHQIAASAPIPLGAEITRHANTDQRLPVVEIDPPSSSPSVSSQSPAKRSA